MHRLLGPGVQHGYGRVGSGGNATLKPPLVKGEPTGAPIAHSDHPHCSSCSGHHNYCSGHPNFHHAMPHQDFPKFDGTSPKLWIKRCDSYFDLYDIPPDNWVKLATIYFIGTAAFWMQTIELNLRQCPWDTFCNHGVDHFDKDQFNQFIHQFFHVSQTASVVEYITLFDELMHQLLAHDPLVNLAFITSKFIDGFHDDIKSVVLLHRPKYLDTASALAIL
jgi:hypothetical protein